MLLIHAARMVNVSVDFPYIIEVSVERLEVTFLVSRSQLTCVVRSFQNK